MKLRGGLAVFGMLTRIWRRPATTSVSTYQIVCTCGSRLTGVRHVHAQTLRCPACGHESFVLAASPLPPVLAVPEQAPAGRPLGPPLRPQVLLLLLVGLLLAVLAAVYPTLRAWWTFRPPEPGSSTLVPQHRTNGLIALGDGNFQLAVRELQAALALMERFPTALSAQEHRQLLQLHRQAALLADLLHEPLAVLLHRAANGPEQEWRADFARNYHRRAIVFDALVNRNREGQYEVSYAVWDGKELANLDLRDVVLLTGLPLEQPRRLLFGARLEEIVRDPATGRWRIRFMPDSGVLLTEPAAVEACLFVPVDQSLREVLERQLEWVSGRD